MRRGGAGKRRDEAEIAIVAALKAIGCDIWQLNVPGLPDLLVRYRGTLSWLEVKSPGGTLTKLQQQTYDRGAFPVVETAMEALALYGIGEWCVEDLGTNTIP